MSSEQLEATFSELALAGLRAYQSRVYPAMSRQEAWDARLADQKAGIPAIPFEDLVKQREREEAVKQETKQLLEQMVNRASQPQPSTKVGLDPTRPYHPIFNSSQEDIDRDRAFLLDDERKRERARYDEYWHDAVRRVMGGQFPSRRALADYYGKSVGWGQNLVKMMLKHEVFSPEEADTFFSGDKRTTTSTDTRSTHEVELARLHSLSRDEWEQICQEAKPLPLTVDTLVNCYVKMHKFNSPTGLAAYLGKPQVYGQAFKTFVLREGLMSEWEFEGCFLKHRGRPRNQPRPEGEIRAKGVPRSASLARKPRSKSAATAMQQSQYSFSERLATHT